MVRTSENFTWRFVALDKIVFVVLSLCRIIEKVMKSDKDVRETTGRIYLLIVPTASG
jgi:hypothetical protein